MMFSCLRIIFLLLLLASVFSESGPLGSAEPQNKPIKVITFNVQFLPGPARIANKRPKLEYRAERIGREMARFDIVGLNETFDDAPREIVMNQLRQAWGDDAHFVVHPRPDEKRFNGGLLIATRLPILESHFLHYSQASSPQKYGLLADGFAAKGVLHGRIARSKDSSKDDYLDLFITHLEARDSSIRETQYPELAEFIKKFGDSSHPCLLMGDMNTRGNADAQKDSNSQYTRMLKIYNSSRASQFPFLDLWPQLRGDAPGGTDDPEKGEEDERIDYVFFSNSPSAPHQLKPDSVRTNPFLDFEIVALSDHSAVEADFDWR